MWGIVRTRFLFRGFEVFSVDVLGVDAVFGKTERGWVGFEMVWIRLVWGVR